MTWIQRGPGSFEGIPEPPPPDEDLKRHITISGIPAETRATHRLARWVRSKETEEALQATTSFAWGDFSPWSLLLMGTAGTGKTHLALAVAWEWLERGRIVAYWQVERFLDELRRGFRAFKEETGDYQETLGFAMNTPLLILDDLGAEKETEWARAKLDEVIDHRYIRKMPTIVTANVTIERLPERIADRLMEGAVLRLRGESFRRRGTAHPRGND